jgi:hypothetical protein
MKAASLLIVFCLFAAPAVAEITDESLNQKATKKNTYNNKFEHCRLILAMQKKGVCHLEFPDFSSLATLHSSSYP